MTKESLNPSVPPALQEGPPDKLPLSSSGDSIYQLVLNLFIFYFYPGKFENGTAAMNLHHLRNALTLRRGPQRWKAAK